MKNNKYKILVLSDLTKSVTSTLKSSASLAKMIGGNVDFFCVKKPTDIIEKDNQLSAMRTINEKYNKTGKEIENIIKPISNDYKVAINYSYTFGNVKNEITDYISNHKPDIIVLGKRKSKVLGILGDNVTNFILKTFDGNIMIASDKNTLDISDKLSLGILNEAKTDSSKELTESLISLSQNPTKVFNVFENSNSSTKTNSDVSKKKVEYVFEKGDNTIKNIANYLTKSNTNLVCLDRNKNQKNYNLKEVINNLDCSLILTN